MSQKDAELLNKFETKWYLDKYELNSLIDEAMLVNETLKLTYTSNTSIIGVSRKLLIEYETMLFFVIGKKYFNSKKKN